METRLKPFDPRRTAISAPIWTLAGLALAGCGGGGSGGSLGPSPIPGLFASVSFTDGGALPGVSNFGVEGSRTTFNEFSFPSLSNAANVALGNVDGHAWDVSARELKVIGGSGTTGTTPNDGFAANEWKTMKSGGCTSDGFSINVMGCTFTAVELTLTLADGTLPANVAGLQSSHVTEIELVVSLTIMPSGTPEIDSFTANINRDDRVSIYTIDAANAPMQWVRVEHGHAAGPRYEFFTADPTQGSPNPNPADFHQDNQRTLNILLGGQDAIVYDVEYLNASDNMVITGMDHPQAQEVMRSDLGNAGIIVRFKVSAPNDATPDVEIALYDGLIDRGATQLVNHRDVAPPDSNGVYTHTFSTSEIASASFVLAEFNVDQDGFTTFASAANYGDGLGVEII